MLCRGGAAQAEALDVVRPSRVLLHSVVEPFLGAAHQVDPGKASVESGRRLNPKPYRTICSWGFWRRASVSHPPHEAKRESPRIHRWNGRIQAEGTCRAERFGLEGLRVLRAYRAPYTSLKGQSRGHKVPSSPNC